MPSSIDDLSERLRLNVSEGLLLGVFVKQNHIEGATFMVFQLLDFLWNVSCAWTLLGVDPPKVRFEPQGGQVGRSSLQTSSGDLCSLLSSGGE